MLQLILHVFGDFFVQTDYQALRKKNKGWEGFWCCLKHCTAYSLPFLLIASWQAVLAIFITHFIIDRTQIIAYLIAIKNNTKIELKSIHKSVYDISNFGMGKERPVFITIWIYIIVDNLAHIVCNYLAIKYL